MKKQKVIVYRRTRVDQREISDTQDHIHMSTTTNNTHNSHLTRTIIGLVTVTDANSNQC
jgi:hypothetical protein